MSRYICQGHYKDGHGHVIASGTVTVYEAGLTTLATCYADTSTSTPISGSQITTDSAGYYKFYIDTEDYRYTKKFAVRLTKNNYQTVEYDNLIVLPNLSGVRYPYTDLLGFTTLQEGIDSANNAGTGRKYLLPPQGDYSGVHTITAPLDFTGANFELEGVRGRDSSWTGSTIKASGALASILDINNCDFFEIRKLRLDGNATAVKGIKLGLTSGHASNLLLEDITIQNVTGIAIDTDAGPGGPMADSSIVRPIIETAGTGIAIGGQVIRVYAGTIGGCTTAGITMAASSSAVFYGTVFTGNGIDIKYTGNDTISSLDFFGCWFENSTVAVFKRPDVPSITAAAAPISFIGCHFHALVGAENLLDFTNYAGTVYIIGGHWDSSGKGSVVVPANCILYIDAPFADQLSYSGAGTIIFGPSCNRVHARAYRGTSNQSVNAGGWTKVQLNAESWDYKSKFDSTTNNRYQPGQAGLYGVKASVQFAAGEVGKSYFAALYVDGALVLAKRLIASLAGQTVDVQIADDIVLGASSYLELYCYHDSAAAKDVVFDANGSTTHMSVHRVG